MPAARSARAVEQTIPTATIGLVSGTLGIGLSLYSNVGYDPRKDFAAIGRIGTAPNTPGIRRFGQDAAEFVAYAKQNPGRSTMFRHWHRSCSGVYFANAAGIDLVHRALRTGPALSDPIAGISRHSPRSPRAIRSIMAARPACLHEFNR